MTTRGISPIAQRATAASVGPSQLSFEPNAYMAHHNQYRLPATYYKPNRRLRSARAATLPASRITH